MGIGRRVLTSAGIATVIAGGSAATIGTAPAFAAAEPGQALNNDYGQSDYERSAEIKAQVEATSAVKAARSTYATKHARYLYLVKVTATRYTAYKKALATHSATKIAAAKKSYLTTRAARDAAKKSSDAAYSAMLATLSKYKTYWTAKHYRPVDGTYTGDVAQYFIGGIGLEPMQVQITVYGGHVSDVAAVQYTKTGSSRYYNEIALPTLLVEAMNAGDSAKVATVTSATLSSEAFAKSLASALLKAGYKL
jgi:uncharacterized protein with FMN-binding domain